MLLGKTSALAGLCYFFAPKKGLAVEKSNHFDTLTAAQKKLAAKWVRACGPHDSAGSNSFLLLPPPGRQNGDFSKAISREAWFIDAALNG